MAGVSAPGVCAAGPGSRGRGVPEVRKFRGQACAQPGYYYERHSPTVTVMLDSCDEYCLALLQVVPAITAPCLAHDK